MDWPPQSPCKTRWRKLISEVRVAKVVVNNTPNPADVSGLSYPMNVSCVTGTMPPTTLPITLAGGGSLVLPNIPSGSVCTVSETPPPAPTTGCPAGSVPTWVTPPTYAPPSVTTGSGTPPVLTVTNTLNCTPSGGGSGQLGALVVTKNVTDNTLGPVTNTTYAVNVTCGGAVTPLTLTPNVPQTVSNIPYQTQCSVAETEVLQTPPLSACINAPTHSAPVWTTTITPTPVTINGPSTAVTVQNTLDCKPQRPELRPRSRQESDPEQHAGRRFDIDVFRCRHLRQCNVKSDDRAQSWGEDLVQCANRRYLHGDRDAAVTTGDRLPCRPDAGLDAAAQLRAAERNHGGRH